MNIFGPFNASDAWQLFHQVALNEELFQVEGALEKKLATYCTYPLFFEMCELPKKELAPYSQRPLLAERQPETARDVLPRSCVNASFVENPTFNPLHHLTTPPFFVTKFQSCTDPHGIWERASHGADTSACECMLGFFYHGSSCV